MKIMKVCGKTLKMYNKTSYCSECKGKCCQTPGAYHPFQFFNRNDRIETKLKKILKATKNLFIKFEQIGNYIILSPQKGKDNKCIYLTNKGCQLSRNERPLECLTLKASTGFLWGCENQLCLEDIKKFWKNYQGILTYAHKEQKEWLHALDNSK